LLRHVSLNLPRRSIFRPKARKLSRKGKKARVGRICESGSRRESEQVPEQKTGNRARFRREENGDETCVKSAMMRGKSERKSARKGRVEK